MINIKYCRRCGKAFDIGINYDECPECRNINRDERRGKEDGIKNC